MESTKKVSWELKEDHLAKFSTVDAECNGTKPGIVLNHSNRGDYCYNFLVNGVWKACQNS